MAAPQQQHQHTLTNTSTASLTASHHHHHHHTVLSSVGHHQGDFYTKLSSDTLGPDVHRVVVPPATHPNLLLAIPRPASRRPRPCSLCGTSAVRPQPTLAPPPSTTNTHLDSNEQPVVLLHRLEDGLPQVDVNSLRAYGTIRLLPVHGPTNLSNSASETFNSNHDGEGAMMAHAAYQANNGPRIEHTKWSVSRSRDGLTPLSEIHQEHIINENHQLSELGRTDYSCKTSVTNVDNKSGSVCDGNSHSAYYIGLEKSASERVGRGTAECAVGGRLESDRRKIGVVASPLHQALASPPHSPTQHPSISSPANTYTLVPTDSQTQVSSPITTQSSLLSSPYHDSVNIGYSSRSSPTRTLQSSSNTPDHSLHTSSPSSPYTPMSVLLPYPSSSPIALPSCSPESSRPPLSPPSPTISPLESPASPPSPPPSLYSPTNLQTFSSACPLNMPPSSPYSPRTLPSIPNSPASLPSRSSSPPSPATSLGSPPLSPVPTPLQSHFIIEPNQELFNPSSPVVASPNHEAKEYCEINQPNTKPEQSPNARLSSSLESLVNHETSHSSETQENNNTVPQLGQLEHTQLKQSGDIHPEKIEEIRNQVQEGEDKLVHAQDNKADSAQLSSELEYSENDANFEKDQTDSKNLLMKLVLKVKHPGDLSPVESEKKDCNKENGIPKIVLTRKGNGPNREYSCSNRLSNEGQNSSSEAALNKKHKSKKNKKEKVKNKKMKKVIKSDKHKRHLELFGEDSNDSCDISPENCNGPLGTEDGPLGTEEQRTESPSTEPPQDLPVAFPTLGESPENSGSELPPTPKQREQYSFSVKVESVCSKLMHSPTSESIDDSLSDSLPDLESPPHLEHDNNPKCTVLQSPVVEQNKEEEEIRLKCEIEVELDVAPKESAPLIKTKSEITDSDKASTVIKKKGKPGRKPREKSSEKLNCKETTINKEQSSPTRSRRDRHVKKTESGRNSDACLWVSFGINAPVPVPASDMPGLANEDEVRADKDSNESEPESLEKEELPDLCSIKREGNCPAPTTENMPIINKITKHEIKNKEKENSIKKLVKDMNDSFSLDVHNGSSGQPKRRRRKRNTKVSKANKKYGLSSSKPFRRHRASSNYNQSSQRKTRSSSTSKSKDQTKVSDSKTEEVYNTISGNDMNENQHTDMKRDTDQDQHSSKAYVKTQDTVKDPNPNTDNKSSFKDSQVPSPTLHQDIKQNPTTNETTSSQQDKNLDQKPNENHDQIPSQDEEIIPNEIIHQDKNTHTDQNTNSLILNCNNEENTNQDNKDSQSQDITTVSIPSQEENISISKDNSSIPDTLCQEPTEQQTKYQHSSTPQAPQENQTPDTNDVLDNTTDRKHESADCNTKVSTIKEPDTLNSIPGPSISPLEEKSQSVIESTEVSTTQNLIAAMPENVKDNSTFRNDEPTQYYRPKKIRKVGHSSLQSHSSRDGSASPQVQSAVRNSEAAKEESHVASNSSTPNTEHQPEAVKEESVVISTERPHDKPITSDTSQTPRTTTESITSPTRDDDLRREKTNGEQGGESKSITETQESTKNSKCAVENLQIGEKTKKRKPSSRSPRKQVSKGESKDSQDSLSSQSEDGKTEGATEKGEDDSNGKESTKEDCVKTPETKKRKGRRGKKKDLPGSVIREEPHYEERRNRLSREIKGFNWLEQKIKNGSLNSGPGGGGGPSSASSSSGSLNTVPAGGSTTTTTTTPSSGGLLRSISVSGCSSSSSTPREPGRTLSGLLQDPSFPSQAAPSPFTTSRKDERSIARRNSVSGSTGLRGHLQIAVPPSAPSSRVTALPKLRPAPPTPTTASPVTPSPATTAATVVVPYSAPGAHIMTVQSPLLTTSHTPHHHGLGLGRVAGSVLVSDALYGYQLSDSNKATLYSSNSQSKATLYGVQDDSLELFYDTVKAPPTNYYGSSSKSDTTNTTTNPTLHLPVNYVSTQSQVAASQSSGVSTSAYTLAPSTVTAATTISASPHPRPQHSGVTWPQQQNPSTNSGPPRTPSEPDPKHFSHKHTLLRRAFRELLKSESESSPEPPPQNERAMEPFVSASEPSTKDDNQSELKENPRNSSTSNSSIVSSPATPNTQITTSTPILTSGKTTPSSSIPTTAMHDAQNSAVASPTSIAVQKPSVSAGEITHKSDTKDYPRPSAVQERRPSLTIKDENKISFQAMIKTEIPDNDMPEVESEIPLTISNQDSAEINKSIESDSMQKLKSEESKREVDVVKDLPGSIESKVIKAIANEVDVDVECLKDDSKTTAKTEKDKTEMQSTFILSVLYKELMKTRQEVEKLRKVQERMLTDKGDKKEKSEDEDTKECMETDDIPAASTSSEEKVCEKRKFEDISSSDEQREMGNDYTSESEMKKQKISIRSDLLPTLVPGTSTASPQDTIESTVHQQAISPLMTKSPQTSPLPTEPNTEISVIAIKSCEQQDISQEIPLASPLQPIVCSTTPQSSPGLPRASPGMVASSPGLSRATPGAATASPGIPASSPGLARASPGMSGNNSGVARSNPGVARAHPDVGERSPGVARSSPGMPRSSPGIPRSSPGMPRSSPSMPRSSPGMQRSSPGIPRNSPGVPRISPGLPQCSPIFSTASVMVPHTSPVITYSSIAVPHTSPIFMNVPHVQVPCCSVRENSVTTITEHPATTMAACRTMPPPNATMVPALPLSSPTGTRVSPVVSRTSPNLSKTSSIPSTTMSKTDPAIAGLSPNKLRSVFGISNTDVELMPVSIGPKQSISEPVSQTFLKLVEEQQPVNPILLNAFKGFRGRTSSKESDSAAAHASSSFKCPQEDPRRGFHTQPYEGEMRRTAYSTSDLPEFPPSSRKLPPPLKPAAALVRRHSDVHNPHSMNPAMHRLIYPSSAHTHPVSSLHTSQSTNPHNTVPSYSHSQSSIARFAPPHQGGHRSGDINNSDRSREYQQAVAMGMQQQFPQHLTPGQNMMRSLGPDKATIFAIPPPMPQSIRQYKSAAVPTSISNMMEQYQSENLFRQSYPFFEKLKENIKQTYEAGLCPTDRQGHPTQKRQQPSTSNAEKPLQPQTFVPRILVRENIPEALQHMPPVTFAAHFPSAGQHMPGLMTSHHGHFANPMNSASVMHQLPQGPIHPGNHHVAPQVGPHPATTRRHNNPNDTQSEKKQCLNCPQQARFLCSGCKKAWYCSGQCQRDHWTTHNPDCVLDVQQ